MNNNFQEKAPLQKIFEASAIGIMAIGQDGTIIMANPASTDLFGYEPMALANKNSDVLVPQRLKKHYDAYLKKQTRFPLKEFVAWGIKKNGDKIRISVDLSPTEIENQKAILIFFWDSNHLKKDVRLIPPANSNLTDRDDKLDALINNLPGIVYRCKNNQNFDLAFISAGCFEITGYGIEAFNEQNLAFSKLICEEDRDRVWESLQNAVKQKAPYSLEYRIQHKDGSIKHVLNKGQAISNAQSEVAMLEGLITDITSLKESVLDVSQSDAKIKALLEAIPDTVFVEDRVVKNIDWDTNTPDSLFVPLLKFAGIPIENASPNTVFQNIKKSHIREMESGKMQLAEYSFLNNHKLVHHEALAVLMNGHSLLTIIRDMTEQKATDVLLDIRNNALASAINSIFIADAQQPNAPIIYSNRAFQKMTGYASSEILGKNCLFLQNDDLDQKEIKILHHAIKNGDACNVTVRNYKKDGSPFWNDITITPVHNNDNQLTHFIGVQNDITHKVKSQNLKEHIRKILELIAKDKTLKTIGQNIVTTVESHIIGSMASIFILDSKKEKFNILVAPNVPKSLIERIVSSLLNVKSADTGQTCFLEKILIAPEISENELLKSCKETALDNDINAWWSFPIKSSTKEVVGIFAVFNKFSREPSASEKEFILDMIDLISIPIEKENNWIKLQESKFQLEKYTQELEERVQERTKEVLSTVQKLVETNSNLEDQILKAEQAEKLAKSTKGIASEIAKNFPNGLVAVIDKDLKILFAEGDSLVQLGLEKVFYEGMYIDDISNLPNKIEILRKKNVLKTLAGERLSFEINYKNRYFAVNTVPLIDENNEINYALHVFSDISQQKEVEFTIQKALEKERELNNLKSRFISMASHEFRTPLSAILTATILISKQNKPGNEIKINKYVTQIEKNINHLTSILNDFLSLSKLEEGKLIAVPERFDLIPFSESLVKDSFIGQKKEQTIIVTHTSLELYVFLDKKLLSHVLSNLLSNASKYSPSGAIIDFKIYQKEGRVVLQITDKGIGVPKEEMAYLFTRFFRAKNAVNVEGTGLGLNIVKLYTELMGGTVDFKTEIDKGSTFWIEFPIQNI